MEKTKKIQGVESNSHGTDMGSFESSNRTSKKQGQSSSIPQAHNGDTY